MKVQQIESQFQMENKYMNSEVLGVVISRDEYNKYLLLKKRDTPVKKILDEKHRVLRCPICNYVVDNAVPKQKFCDKCGQRLKG